MFALQAASSRPLQTDAAFFSTGALVAGVGALAAGAAGVVCAFGAGDNCAPAVVTNRQSEAVATARPAPQMVIFLFTAFISNG